MIKKIIESARLKLNKKYDSNISFNISKWLIEEVTQQSYLDLIFNKNIEISNEEINKFNYLINEHIENDHPIAYLIGHVNFLDSKIYVEQPILIPRPETEQWCNQIIEQLKKIFKKTDKKLTMLDLCSGSGCIAIAFAKSDFFEKIDAIDINEQSIKLINKNIKSTKTNNIINAIHCDLFEKIEHKKYDLIVSNPPYISEIAWQNLDKNVKNFEDKNALVSDNNGLEIIERIIKTSKFHLNQNSLLIDNNLHQLIIEIGFDQHKEVEKIFEKYGYKNIKTSFDFQNHPRIVAGNLK